MVKIMDRGEVVIIMFRDSYLVLYSLRTVST